LSRTNPIADAEILSLLKDGSHTRLISEHRQIFPRSHRLPGRFTGYRRHPDDRHHSYSGFGI